MVESGGVSLESGEGRGRLGLCYVGYDKKKYSVLKYLSTSLPRREREDLEKEEA